MQKIQEEGLANSLEMQDRRWRCKNCDAAHSWYHETCPQCGQAVANYQADV
jgi:rubrerythrin